MPSPAVVTKQAVVSIPLAKIAPNPHQPRRRFKAGSIQAMADSLKAFGQETAAKVRPLTREELLLYPGCEYLLIGGHRRLAGAKLAGWMALDCIVLEIPPSETHRKAVMDNDSEEMDWWDWDLAIEEEAHTHPELTQRELAERFDKGLTKVNTAIRITKALNPEARELVNQNLDQAAAQEDDFVRPPNKKEAPYQITESILLALADLSDPLPALKVVLDRHLTESQVRQLVEKVKAGQKPGEVVLEAKPKTPRAAKTSPQSTVHSSQPKEEPVSLGTPVGEKASHKSPLSPPLTKGGGGDLAAMPSEPSFLWKEMAGITLISRIKGKLKKGEKPTFGEALILIGHFLVNLAGWLWKHILRPVLKTLIGLGKKVLGEAWRLVKDAVKLVTHSLRGILKGVLSVLLSVFLGGLVLYFVYDWVNYGLNVPRAVEGYAAFLERSAHWLWRVVAR